MVIFDLPSFIIIRAGRNFPAIKHSSSMHKLTTLGIVSLNKSNPPTLLFPAIRINDFPEHPSDARCTLLYISNYI